MTRYYIHHWMGNEELKRSFPDALEDETGRCYVDIEDEKLGVWIKELATRFDVMIRSTETTFVIMVDFKGGKFRQR